MGWRSPFLKADGRDCNQKKNRFIKIGASNSDSFDVGLRILIHISSEGDSDYILVKSKLLEFNRSDSRRRNRIPPAPCFLKSCFLCHKTLSHDKDVYMYRGDQGFCSQECRSRQIYMDEMTELEISTKIMLASYRKYLYGGGGRRCEPNILQEELRHRHKPLPPKHRVIFL